MRAAPPEGRNPASLNGPVHERNLAQCRAAFADMDPPRVLWTQARTVVNCQHFVCQDRGPDSTAFTSGRP